MDRKEFLKTCCLLGAAVPASSLIQSCGPLQYYANSTFATNVITIRKSEFIAVRRDKQTIRDFILVRNEKLEFPVCIYRHGDSEFSALYTRCTHRGCEVKPSRNYLHCPCHGSEFSNKGEVLNPPAEKNLEQFQITFDDENIYVHI